MTRVLLLGMLISVFVLVGCDQQTEVAQEQTETELLSQSTVIPDTPVPNTPMPTIKPTKIEAPKIKKKESQLPKPPQGKSEKNRPTPPLMVKQSYRIKAAASKYSLVGTIQFELDNTEIVTIEQMDSGSIVGPSVVQLLNGQYRMYLQSRPKGYPRLIDGYDITHIVSLISDDASTWEIEPGVRIEHGGVDDLDYQAGEPEAFIGKEDKYYMAYTGRYLGVDEGSGKDQLMHRILFATSDDGLEWTKTGTHFAGELRNDFASSADVTLIDDEYVIYYSGGRAIASTTSADGLNWEKGSLLFDFGHDSTVVEYEDNYYMFVKVPKEFYYEKNPELEKDILGMVMSEDGVNWSKEFYQVVVNDEYGDAIPVFELQDPGSVTLPDGSFRVYLNSNKGASIYSIKPAEALPRP